jgi:hypothetical protein
MIKTFIFSDLTCLGAQKAPDKAKKRVRRLTERPHFDST